MVANFCEAMFGTYDTAHLIACVVDGLGHIIGSFDVLVAICSMVACMCAAHAEHRIVDSQLVQYLVWIGRVIPPFSINHQSVLVFAGGSKKYFMYSVILLNGFYAFIGYPVIKFASDFQVSVHVILIYQLNAVKSVGRSFDSDSAVSSLLALNEVNVIIVIQQDIQCMLHGDFSVV